MSYCVKCGNTGIDIDGNPCTCRFAANTFYESVSCMELPEQYRGISFNKALVPKDMHESYANYLQGLHDDISNLRLSNRNIAICSPVNHSKTILAYSCIEILFRQGITTFPIYDILELKRMLLDMDMNKKPLYEVSEPERILTAPILFVKIPRVTNWDVYDTMLLLLDRRVRRGNSTIMLFDGTWNQLIYNDKNNLVAGLIGDGTYNTIEVKSFVPTVEVNNSLPEIQLKDNI